MSTKSFLQRTIPGLIIALITGIPVHAQNEAIGAGSAGSAANDQKFLQSAAVDGATEVALGQQAMLRAQSNPTRDMARQLVADHTQANRELASIAMRKHVEISTQPDPSAMAKEQTWGTGAMYDHAYANAMVHDHHDAINLFSAAAQSDDPDIRQFAKSTLPVLKKHLSMAEALNQGRATPGSTSP